MINHKATISALADELQSIVGYSFSQIYTQSQGLLIIEITDGKSVLFLEFSTNSPYDRLLLRNRHNRAKANTKDLFGVLVGETITNINQVNEDRILVISTQTHNLYFVMFGHNKSDLLVTTKKNKIIHSLNNLDIVGTKISIDTNEQKDISDFDGDTFFSDALKKCKYYFGKYYTESYLANNGLTKKTLVKDINIDAQTENVERYYYQLARAKESYVYKLSDDKYLLSLIELDGYELHKKCDSISEGIRTKFVREVSKKRITELKKKSLGKLVKLIKKDETAIQRIKKLEDGESKSEELRHFAEMLISQPNPKIKSGKEIELVDWEGNILKIALDEKLSLIDNAQKYFKKSSNVLKERTIAKAKLPELELQLVDKMQLQATIESTDDVKRLEEILVDNRKILGDIVERKGPEIREEKFKKYELSENFVLYVGKNAKNNDELTMKFAKPNDIWLHARGVGGSHCVIRVDGREPSKGIIKEAAAIAAFYSKAKTSHLAPVAYTQKKYVSKPKGANPGAVVLRREEVVLVEPYKPE
ncbi:MAG: NFACT RNA binding domain-containing protein [Candidatus Kapaibacterium sp.]